MKMLVVSQNVMRTDKGERRDTLDQRWSLFLSCCGLVLWPVPNQVEVVRRWIREADLAGILLTGGNSLVICGGDAPERDATERFLIDHAIENDLPLLGVCRGMQSIQAYFGASFFPVSGHVTPNQRVIARGVPVEVNSYHNFAASDSVPELLVWARAEDGVVEAVEHVEHPILGVMWHPERFPMFRDEDLDMFMRHFHVSGQ